jgi:hypothetical protein
MVTLLKAVCGRKSANGSVVSIIYKAVGIRTVRTNSLTVGGNLPILRTREYEPWRRRPPKDDWRDLRAGFGVDANEHPQNQHRQHGALCVGALSGDDDLSNTLQRV